jgi:hypothetical protein
MMRALVLGEPPLVHETLAAGVAGEGADPLVAPHVNPQRLRVQEALAAHRAGVGANPVVPHAVHLQPVFKIRIIFGAYRIRIRNYLYGYGSGSFYQQAKRILR